MNEATAWGVVEFEDEKEHLGSAFVVDSPTEVLARRVLMDACREFASRRPLADVGEEAFAYDYDDKHHRDSFGVQIGHLAFRRGRAVVYLRFAKVRPEDLVPYAQKLDARVQAVFGYAAPTTTVKQSQQNKKEQIPWTRGNPAALAAVANEAAAAEIENQAREKASNERLQREQAAAELVKKFRITAQQEAALRAMRFIDCLTKERRAAMQKPQQGLDTGKGWEYVQVRGFGVADTAEDGEAIARDFVSGAKGHFHEPGTGRCVGTILFREGPLSREFSDPKWYRRISPTDNRLEEVFEFDERGKVRQYTRYLMPSATGLDEPVEVGQVTLE